MHTRILVRAVEAYRYWLSPVLGQNCRFHPSCSEYCATALHHHGAARGLRLALHRVLRCGPWHPGGYDPVPDARSPDAERTEP